MPYDQFKLIMGVRRKSGRKRELLRHFTEAENQQALDQYFDEKLTTQQIVDHLGYPIRQNLERWLRKDPRYAESIAHNFYPVDSKIKVVAMYLSGQFSLNIVIAHPSPYY